MNKLIFDCSFVCYESYVLLTEFIKLKIQTRKDNRDIICSGTAHVGWFTCQCTSLKFELVPLDEVAVDVPTAKLPTDLGRYITFLGTRQVVMAIY